MRHVTRNWIAMAGLGVGLVGAGAIEQARLAQREAAARPLREAHRECEQLRAEHEQLREKAPSSAQLAALRADRTALDALRSEVAALREREHLPERKRAATAAAAEPSTELSRVVPAASWANRGRATPEAVLETTLWAASAGEVDVLAQNLWLEPGARRRAEAFLEQLPSGERAKYATPERLIAVMTAKEIPLGSLQRVAGMTLANGDRLLRVRLQAPDGSAKTASIAARGGPGDWRLVVPASAVERYLAQLAR